MKKQVTIVLLALGFFLGGCYPQGPEYVEDLDVVITNHNADYDFSAKGTYAMPDKIVKITGNLSEGDAPVFIPDAVAAQILSQIESNMNDLGYTRVDIDADPDLLLTPASWETTTILYWYDYWYWWWGGYYPGWGYPPVNVSTYTTGTLVMALVDPTIESANGNPIPQWTGAINGLLTGVYDPIRVNKAIDQAYTQSPYLKTN
ncbi:MAG: DUF4136 domain-containing protein [Bacteroidota bacterium]